MAKLVLLLVFVCFQFSRPEELTADKLVGQELIPEDEVPFNNQTAPDIETLDGADEEQWYQGEYVYSEDEAPFNDQTAPDTEILYGGGESDEVPFNDQTAPDTEILDGVDESGEAPFNDQTAPDTTILDESEEVPFNDQTAPDTEIPGGIGIKPLYQGFGYDPANPIWGDYEEMMVNDTDYQKLVEEIDRELNAWKEKYPGSQDPAAWEHAGDWYDDYLGADDYKDTDYVTEDTDMIINNGGNMYAYSSMSTLTKLKPNAGKFGQSLNAGKMGQGRNTQQGQKWGYGKRQPVKRFTSV